MHKIFPRSAVIALAALSATAATAAVTSFEEQAAHLEEGRIIQSPIAGVKNHFWFDYRANVNEAQKELASDLRHADRFADKRDAWDEYAHELRGERSHYIKVMEKRGYRYGYVVVEDE